MRIRTSSGVYGAGEASASLYISPAGEPEFVASACYIGGNNQGGEAALRPLMEFGHPKAKEIGPKKYTEVQVLGDAGYPYGHNVYWRSNFLTQITDEVVEAMIDLFRSADSPSLGMDLFHLGGAVSRVEREATAFFHRDAQYDFLISAVWPGMGESEENITCVRSVWQQMQRLITPAVYVNNLGD